MRARIVLPVLATVVAATFLVPGVATAGGANQPITADLNGDGLVDRATLGPETGVPSGTPTCTVSVEIRKPNGTYKAPVVHSYPSPWTRQPYCPNMGEGINLAHNGKTELVLTNFNASPAQTALFALKNYQVAGVFTGVHFPSTIRSADFNGDGRTDIWESSDESMQLRTFTNTGNGTLVPGAISVCSVRSVPQHVLADFNGDGGQDFLISLYCYPNTQTVQVLFGNGQPPVTLVDGPGTVFQVDLDGNGVPDAGVITNTGTRYFHNDGHGNFTETTGSFAGVLAARHAPSSAAIAAEQARVSH